MAIVENNVVKMEWQKEGWLQTKKGTGAFIFASQVYETETRGKVTVFFNPSTAYLFVTDAHTENEDLWSAEDLIPVLKKEYTYLFPFNVQEYVPVIESGETECRADILEEYGLTPFKADIEARLNDVRPFGDEVAVSHL